MTIRKFSSSNRLAFTLVELLVVMAIIGILVGLLFPAVQAVRETSSNTSCVNNIRQIGISVQNYVSSKRRIPPSRGADGYVTWTVLLMPYMEEGSLHQQFDELLPYASQDSEAVRQSVDLFFCPSRRSPGELSLFEQFDVQIGSVGDYAGNAGSEQFFMPGTTFTGEWSLFDVEVDGVMNSGLAASNRIDSTTGRLRNSPRGRYTLSDISDGLSNTVFFGEKSVSPQHMGEPGGWGDGSIYNGNEPGTFMRLGGFGLPIQMDRRVEPPGPGGIPTFGSAHSSTCNFVFGDGSTRSISELIDEEILHRLCSRKDGQPIPALD